MKKKTHDFHYYFLIHALRRAKTELPNLNFRQFFYSERLIHSKWHLKRSMILNLKKIITAVFLLREPLPKPKIGQPNFDFGQFFCCKQL